MDDPTTLIKKCFDNDGEEGNFPLSDRLFPYTVIGPPSDGGRIIYTTKIQPVALALSTHGDSHHLGLISRHGLPSDDDAAWIRAVVGPREVLFLGDMDPIDLLIFAWLRARLHPIRVVQLGINDAYLDKLQVVVPESFMLSQPPDEQESLPLLMRVLPDIRDILGPRCTQLLNQGRKIELEAVVSAKGSPAAIIPPDLQLMSNKRVSD